MPYIWTCAEENLDDRRYRKLVLEILDTISVDIKKIRDVEIVELCDTQVVVPYASTSFLRFIITDLEGVVTTYDTALDGTTPYVVTGTVAKCNPHLYAGDVCYNEFGVIKSAKAFYGLGDSANMFYRDGATNAILVAPTLADCLSTPQCVTMIDRCIEFNGFSEEDYATLVANGHFPLVFSIGGTGFKYGGYLGAAAGVALTIQAADVSSYTDILLLVSNWLDSFNSPIMFNYVDSSLTLPYAPNGVMGLYYGVFSDAACSFYLPLRIQDALGRDDTYWMAASGSNHAALVESPSGSGTVVDLYPLRPAFLDCITHLESPIVVPNNAGLPVWFNWGA